jgi:phage-related protein
MNEVFEFLGNNQLVLLGLVLAILTAVKQALQKIEEVNVPKWLEVVIKVLRKTIEFVTANDGKTDKK